MAKVYAELSSIRRAGDMDESLVQRVELLTDIFQGLGVDIPQPRLKIEEAAITEMTRE